MGGTKSSPSPRLNRAGGGEKSPVDVSSSLTDEWVKFDDDKVSLVSPEDILRLSGGGDWHIAYVLLYGPRRLEILEEEQ